MICTKKVIISESGEDTFKRQISASTSVRTQSKAATRVMAHAKRSERALANTTADSQVLTSNVSQNAPIAEQMTPNVGVITSDEMDDVSFEADGRSQGTQVAALLCSSEYNDADSAAPAARSREHTSDGTKTKEDADVPVSVTDHFVCIDSAAYTDATAENDGQQLEPGQGMDWRQLATDSVFYDYLLHCHVVPFIHCEYRQDGIRKAMAVPDSDEHDYRKFDCTCEDIGDGLMFGGCPDERCSVPGSVDIKDASYRVTADPELQATERSDGCSYVHKSTTSAIQQLVVNNDGQTSSVVRGSQYIKVLLQLLHVSVIRVVQHPQHIAHQIIRSEERCDSLVVLSESSDGHSYGHVSVIKHDGYAAMQSTVQGSQAQDVSAVETYYGMPMGRARKSHRRGTADKTKHNPKRPHLEEGAPAEAEASEDTTRYVQFELTHERVTNAIAITSRCISTGMQDAFVTDLSTLGFVLEAPEKDVMLARHELVFWARVLDEISKLSCKRYNGDEPIRYQMSQNLTDLAKYGSEAGFEFVLARISFSGYCDECPESNTLNKRHIVCSKADGAGLKRLAYGLLEEVMSAYQNSATSVDSQFKFDLTRTSAAQSVAALGSHIRICAGDSINLNWWTTPRRNSNIDTWFQTVLKRGDQDHRKPVVRLPIGKAIHSSLACYRSTSDVITATGSGWSIEEPTATLCGRLDNNPMPLQLNVDFRFDVQNIQGTNVTECSIAPTKHDYFTNVTISAKLPVRTADDDMGGVNTWRASCHAIALDDANIALNIALIASEANPAPGEAQDPDGKSPSDVVMTIDGTIAALHAGNLYSSPAFHTRSSCNSPVVSQGTRIPGSAHLGVNSIDVTQQLTQRGAVVVPSPACGEDHVQDQSSAPGTAPATRNDAPWHGSAPEGDAPFDYHDGNSFENMVAVVVPTPGRQPDALSPSPAQVVYGQAAYRQGASYRKYHSTVLPLGAQEVYMAPNLGKDGKALRPGIGAQESAHGNVSTENSSKKRKKAKNIVFVLGQQSPATEQTRVTRQQALRTNTAETLEQYIKRTTRVEHMPMNSANSGVAAARTMESVHTPDPSLTPQSTSAHRGYDSHMFTTDKFTFGRNCPGILVIPVTALLDNLMSRIGATEGVLSQSLAQILQQYTMP